ncbi:MAG: hypothetical protein HYZ75_03110 [Elusimicrobia bacterium]|nr:hypothetical protein [Elusimicrobiota bacterium]
MRKFNASVVVGAILLSVPGAAVDAAAQSVAAVRAPAVGVGLAPVAGALGAAPVFRPSMPSLPSVGLMPTLTLPGVVARPSAAVLSASVAAVPVAVAVPAAQAAVAAQAAAPAGPTAVARELTVRLSENPVLAAIAKPAPRSALGSKGAASGVFFDAARPFTSNGIEPVPVSGSRAGPNGLKPAAARRPIPAPDAADFPRRMLEKGNKASTAILWSNVLTLGLGAAVGAAAVITGAAAWTTAAGLVAGLALPFLPAYGRMLALSSMRSVSDGVPTERRTLMFPTLFKGVEQAGLGVALSSLGVKAVLIGAGYAAWTLAATNPVLAALTAAVGLSALLTRSRTAAFADGIELLKIALLGRLREGIPVATDVSSLPGKTSLQKRYWFLKAPDVGAPIARLDSTYLAMREHGLSVVEAFKTALLSHLLFGPKTQSGLSLQERWDLGLLFRPFDIYLPNLFQAQGYSNSRIFAPAGNKRGLTPGDIDLVEFERMFELYAPGRAHMSAADMKRMREGNALRDESEGRGSWFSRWQGVLAAKRRADQLVELYADVVVEEEGRLVPAVSRDMLLRVYRGLAQEDIRRERAY